MIAKESDLAVIHNLDMQLKEYKRKYETAKTELRSFKGALIFFIKRFILYSSLTLEFSNFTTLPQSDET